VKKTRQNPLTKLEAFIRRIVETPFARLFPSRLEPVEIERELERALEENTMLQSEGRRLAPTIYDLYLSVKDHQQIASGQHTLLRDWQNKLILYARKHHITLRTDPLIRLHPDTSLGTGCIRIQAEIADGQNAAADGHMATQALSAEQMEQLRAQIAATGQPIPSGIGGGATKSAPNHPATSGLVPTVHPSPRLPQAWLTIRLPQSGQQTYRLEKLIVNIGRQLSNDIIVEDKRVSRHHAQIKFRSEDGQFAIFDLGSTNGITINNTPHLRHHVLRNGDRFTIGNYDFYFERR
jgi:hypothetical protein